MSETGILNILEVWIPAIKRMAAPEESNKKIDPKLEKQIAKAERLAEIIEKKVLARIAEPQSQKIGREDTKTQKNSERIVARRKNIESTHIKSNDNEISR